jgi:hypothetical protein
MIMSILGHHSDFQSRELADDADQFLAHRGAARLIELFEICLQTSKNFLGGVIIAAEPRR